jgi:hypothetical protein
MYLLIIHSLRASLSLSPPPRIEYGVNSGGGPLKMNDVWLFEYIISYHQYSF